MEVMVIGVVAVVTPRAQVERLVCVPGIWALCKLKGSDEVHSRGTSAYWTIIGKRTLVQDIVRIDRLEALS